MGKKKSGAGDVDTAAVAAARAFVLKVAMHCRCRGCVRRIRSAVRDLTLVHGVEAVDQSALESAGEVRLVATGDAEMFRQRLHRATRKNVELLLPKPPAPAPKKEAPQDHHHRNHLVDQPAAGQYGAWPPNRQSWNNGSLYGAAAAYPAAAWGPYAYPPPPPPAQGHGAAGAYYGSAPAWQGY